LVEDISKIDWKDEIDDADEGQEKRQLSEDSSYDECTQPKKKYSRQEVINNLLFLSLFDIY